MSTLPTRHKLPTLPKLVSLPAVGISSTQPAVLTTLTTQPIKPAVLTTLTTQPIKPATVQLLPTVPQTIPQVVQPPQIVKPIISKFPTDTAPDAEITDVKIEGLNLSFLLKNVTQKTTNSIRVMLYSQIPTLAITRIELQTNNTALYDELISQRLGLLALRSDNVSKLNVPQECICPDNQVCSKCSVQFNIDVTAPAGFHRVTGRNLVCESGDIAGRPWSEVIEFEVPGYESQPQPLVSIRGGQSLKLRCWAIRGVGEQHAKFIPVSKAVPIEIPSNYSDKSRKDYQYNIESVGQLSPEELLNRIKLFLGI